MSNEILFGAASIEPDARFAGMSFDMMQALNIKQLPGKGLAVGARRHAAFSSTNAAIVRCVH